MAPSAAAALKSSRSAAKSVLAVLVRLPEREVQWILLALGAFDALALVRLVDDAAAERAVLGVRAHAEVDVAVDRVSCMRIAAIGIAFDPTERPPAEFPRT
jgi:hypothetical protein